MDKERKIDKLEQRLRDAWRRSEAPSPPEGWKAGVMDAVRAADPPRANHFVERTLWRTALTAACVAIVALVVIPAGTLEITQEVVRLVLLDPAGFLNDLPIEF